MEGGQGQFYSVFGLNFLFRYRYIAAKHFRGSTKYRWSNVSINKLLRAGRVDILRTSLKEFPGRVVLFSSCATFRQGERCKCCFGVGAGLEQRAYLCKLFLRHSEIVETFEPLGESFFVDTPLTANFQSGQLLTVEHALQGPPRYLQ